MRHDFRLTAPGWSFWRPSGLPLLFKTMYLLRYSAETPLVLPDSGGVAA